MDTRFISPGYLLNSLIKSVGLFRQINAKGGRLIERNHASSKSLFPNESYLLKHFGFKQEGFSRCVLNIDGKLTYKDGEFRYG